MPEVCFPANAWTPLPAATIDVWHFDLLPTDADLVLLNAEERARVERLVVPVKRHQLIAGRAALRRILARYIDVAAEALRFAYGEHGKPSSLDDPQLSFNLSHSHGRALLAVARGGRLGADIELARADRAAERIARRFFAPVEHQALVVLPADAQAAFFYRTWARKEAYLKALGTGLSFSSRAFVVDETPRLVSTDWPGDEPKAWRFVDVDVGPEYAAAVCWDAGPAVVRRYVVDGAPEAG